MARVCVVLVAGLDVALLEKTAGLQVIGGMKHQAAYKPAFPAVTCTTQATLTTGAWPSEHGIISNGLYTHGNAALHEKLDLSDHAEARQNVSFWEQGNPLLDKPRFWEGSSRKVAMLFWQQSMRGAADIVITPKPEHTPDGKTLTACWSAPADLYATLVGRLGPFPLHHYWSPMAALPSSQWIAKAAEYVWDTHAPDLQLVYIPHLDYNLQRLGPNHEAVTKDLQDVDALLVPLAEKVRAEGGVLVVAGDYGMYEASQAVLPNVALREAGLLVTKSDAGGKWVVDYETSQAFAMADHQIAHVYLRDGGEHAAAVLKALPGIASVLHKESDEVRALGVANKRSGDLILMAEPSAWFVHDWWLSDVEKPAWQFGVDIHNKPGYDPRELFFDREKKCIAQNPTLVKGAHGRNDDPAKWPMLLADVPLPPPREEGLQATAIAPWLAGLAALI